eukprot:GFUD01003975.1.p1 GENE.GFUD01003975.1~~GFUD01003975.1.p1  ORF type:complete len:250 (-),score=45.63 GFUD01003975.1:246-995(-)
MRWCGNCCGAPGGDGDQGLDAAGHRAEQNNGSVHNVIYNRVGRVKKSKHGGTVLFLGISVLAGLLIILLVQFIAEQQVCTIEVPLQDLPEGIQKIFSKNDQQDSWRCPYNEQFDVSYTLGEVLPTNITSTNVTTFKVHMADITPGKFDTETSTISRLQESVSILCGKRCNLKSCACVKTMITSESCYLEKYQYGLQLQPTNHDEASHGVFGIYFVISAATFIVFIMFYAVFRITTEFWGGKREGIAVIA